MADAGFAEKAGADAIGVVVCSEADSFRSVSLEKAAEIFNSVGPFITTVAVTHTQSDEDLRSIMELKPAAIQIVHPFKIPPTYHGKVIRVLQKGLPLPTDCDAIAVDESMGSGKLFDKEYSRYVVNTSKIPVILSGGLDPDNVAAAIQEIRPYAVDVCSGVEVRPGVKDQNRIAEFILAAKKG